MTENFFRFPKILFMMSAIAHLDKPKLIDLQLATRITYSHLCNMKDVLISKGLIVSKKHGRTLSLELTEKGDEAINKYYDILNLIDLKESDIFGQIIFLEDNKNGMVSNEEI